MPADMDSYDTVLLGTPNWFNTVAPPVASFLADSNMSGKRISLFCTNGGGGLGHTEADVRTICKEAEILDSINIYEDGGAKAKGQLTDWLNLRELRNTEYQRKGGFIRIFDWKKMLSS